MLYSTENFVAGLQSSYNKNPLPVSQSELMPSSHFENKERILFCAEPKDKAIRKKKHQEKYRDRIKENFLKAKQLHDSSEAKHILNTYRDSGYEFETKRDPSGARVKKTELLQIRQIRGAFRKALEASAEKLGFKLGHHVPDRISAKKLAEELTASDEGGALVTTAEVIEHYEHPRPHTPHFQSH